MKTLSLSGVAFNSVENVKVQVNMEFDVDKNLYIIFQDGELVDEVNEDFVNEILAEVGKKVGDFDNDEDLYKELFDIYISVDFGV